MIKKICLQIMVCEEMELVIYMQVCFGELCFPISPQGSRLTAFELVHDNIPATLVADSAAAALMKAGQVNAVVVGADRVAANGMYLKTVLLIDLLY